MGDIAKIRQVSSPALAILGTAVAYAMIISVGRRRCGVERWDGATTVRRQGVRGGGRAFQRAGDGPAAMESSAARLPLTPMLAFLTAGRTNTQPRARPPKPDLHCAVNLHQSIADRALQHGGTAFQHPPSVLGSAELVLCDDKRSGNQN